MDPVEEIAAERQRARGKGDSNADLCFLATVTAEGHPSLSTLVLRDIGPRGFGLLITSASLKWQQLHKLSRYELLILWPTVMRQYRIRGDMAPMEEKLVQQYWNRKGHASRLLEVYYPTFEAQSTVIPSREYLVKGIETLRKRYPEAEDVPRPDTLKGIYLVPQRIEVWHGSGDRLHDRRLYTKGEEGWAEQFLVP